MLLLTTFQVILNGIGILLIKWPQFIVTSTDSGTITSSPTAIDNSDTTAKQHVNKR